MIKKAKSRYLKQDYDYKPRISEQNITGLKEYIKEM